MTLSYTLVRGCNIGDERLEDSEAVSDGAAYPVSQSIPGGSTDLPVEWWIDVSQIKALYIKSPRDMTLKTNSASVPGNTIAVKAGKPVIWSPDCGLLSPLTVDVTYLYVTLAAGEAATLDIRCLVDPTPT